MLALDDYYLPRAERLALAGRVHPLFETRGPPGTHDVTRLRDHLAALATAETVEVPVFDKGRDDRVGVRALAGPFELIVLEGWCVVARAVPYEALRSPCNAVEREEDRDGRWRRAVNDALASGYAALFAMLDELVYLRPPDLESVRACLTRASSVCLRYSRCSPARRSRPWKRWQVASYTLRTAGWTFLTE